MRTRLVMVLSLAVGVVGASRAHAQVGMIGGGPPAMPAPSGSLQAPAAWVLKYRAELNLTADQVGKIEKLKVVEEANLVTIRQAVMGRAMEQMRTGGGLGTLQLAMAWSGPIDEKAIEAQACEQSKLQASLMIAYAKARRAVGAVLTDAQRQQMNGFEREEVRTRVRPPAGRP